MPERPQWVQLDTYACKKFIEDVRDAEFAPLFDGGAFELWERRLRFFDGYYHYSLQNKSIFPYFCLNFISNGDDHFYLDGSEHPLELMIKKGSLRLTEATVMEYIEFHSDVAFYPYRKVKFVTNPYQNPYSGALAIRHHFNALKYHAKFEKTYSEEDESFYIVMPVLYNGETVKGRIQVLKTGEINILEPVNIPLMDGTRDHAPIHYSHPHQKEILQQNIDILIQSEEGKRLYETVQFYGGEVQMMSGVGFNAFAPDTQKAYIVSPQNIETYSPYQVLAIAGILRDIELQYLEEKRPDPFEDMQAYYEENMALNLDILLRLCIIVDELYAAGFEEILRKFKKSGYGQIYSDYKNNKNLESSGMFLAQKYGLNIQKEETSS